MKKHFYPISILVLLALALLWPRVAAAADVDWQLRWLDNNMVQEEIQTSTQKFITTDPNWKMNQDGDKYVLSREIDNWQSYEAMNDGLPLQVQQKNYWIYKKTDIMPVSETSHGLFQQLSDQDNLILTVNVPGFIIGGTGERIDESTNRWIVPNHARAELFQQQKIMTVITADGLLLGIGIVVLGMLFVAIRFIIRLRNVERIIESEYAVTNIKENEQEDSE